MVQQPSIVERLRAAPERVGLASLISCSGRVASVSALAADVDGLSGQLAIGDRLNLAVRDGSHVSAEVVGFRGSRARALAFGDLNGLGVGAPALVSLGASAEPTAARLHIGDGWLGRIIDPLGNPLDGLGSLGNGTGRFVRAGPPQAAVRSGKS